MTLRMDMHQSPTAETIYKLWDETNSCLLDEWVVSCFEDMDAMKDDLRILGFDI